MKPSPIDHEPRSDHVVKNAPSSTDDSEVSECVEPTIPDRCPGCSATPVPDVWWCPQCYLDFKPSTPVPNEPVASEDAEVNADEALPSQRQTDRPTTDPNDLRAQYRLSKQSALDYALAKEDVHAPRHAAQQVTDNNEAEVGHIADQMIADLAAAQPASNLLVERNLKQRLLIGVVATVVLLVLVLGVLSLLGSIT